MSRVVLSFVSLKYFETADVLIMKVYSCVSQFVSAQGLKHELDTSYINVKVYASMLISRNIISAHGLKNELDSCCVACLFRLMDYCFGTLIKERVRFMCSVLILAHGLLFRHMD